MGAVLGSATFLALVALALAGADRPPPPGFVLVVAGAAVCATLVWRLIPRALARWDSSGAWSALVWVGGVGALVGAVTAGILLLLSPGEPSIRPIPVIAVMTWFAVLIVGGAVGALFLLTVARVLDRSTS